MYSMAEKGRPQHGDTPDKWKFQEVPGEWMYQYDDLLKYLDLSAIPWHTSECERLIEEHGAAYFEGLDLS